MNGLLNLVEEKSLYTIDEVQRRKHICNCALISPANSMRTIALRAPAEDKLSLEGISDDLKREICDHLCSYTEDILICEVGGRALLIIPSLYPSSSLCVALEFDEASLFASFCDLLSARNARGYSVSRSRLACQVQE